MLNTFSRSLIILEPAITAWAPEINGAGNELGARRAEQFPHLRNYTLTPDCSQSTVLNMTHA